VAILLIIKISPEFSYILSQMVNNQNNEMGDTLKTYSTTLKEPILSLR
jgi:hypothetical protein